MGIPDEDSWWRRSYLPGGYATGWRRTGCIAVFVALFAVLAMALVVVLVAAVFD